MTQSTDGQICYGIDVGEDLPWDQNEFEDVDDWWIVESGFVWEGKNPFTPEGDYVPGVKRGDSLIKEFFAARSKWRNEHPIPIELVNTCSGQCPQYIVAVPGTVLVANRGYPVAFNPYGYFDFDSLKLAQWKVFCEKYGVEGEPRWYLSSCWW